MLLILIGIFLIFLFLNSGEKEDYDIEESYKKYVKFAKKEKE